MVEIFEQRHHIIGKKFISYIYSARYLINIRVCIGLFVTRRLTMPARIKIRI